MKDRVPLLVKGTRHGAQTQLRVLRFFVGRSRGLCREIFAKSMHVVPLSSSCLYDLLDKENFTRG